MFKNIMAPYVIPIQPLPTQIMPEVSIQSPIRGIMFDVYGTLFISASGDISTIRNNLQTESKLQALLAKYNIPLLPKQLNDLLFKTIESDHATKKMKGFAFPEVLIDQIWMQVLQIDDIKTARCFAAEYEMTVNPVYPMPHLAETLQSLKITDILLGIISNAQFFTPHIFNLFCHAFPESLGFEPDLIFYSYKSGHAKPSLFMFNQAVRMFIKKGINPSEILYIGNDMLNDIYPAHQVGFQTCLFAGDRRSLRLRVNNLQCRGLNPDAIIKELNQMVDMIRL